MTHIADDAMKHYSKSCQSVEPYINAVTAANTWLTINESICTIFQQIQLKQW